MVTETPVVVEPSSSSSSNDTSPENKNETQPLTTTTTTAAAVTPPNINTTTLTTKTTTLPANGTTYKIQIHTPTLGVVLFEPSKLTRSLLSLAPPSLISSLQKFPVVSYIIEHSPAISVGVALGHVLISVDGTSVTDVRHALRLLTRAPRPLQLEFYVPRLKIVIGDGWHWVNYDGKGGMDAGRLKRGDWQRKYVVVGGVIAKPWVINFYKSKAEYDIAVIETQSEIPISVKLKQFSLKGATIQNDAIGPHQSITYPTEQTPWRYFVIVTESGLPIKISSPHLEGLKAVHDAIRKQVIDRPWEDEEDECCDTVEGFCAGSWCVSYK